MTMTEAMTGTTRCLTGWGRTAPARSQVLGPLRQEQLQHLLISGQARGVVARGAGLSYGDAAQNDGGLVLTPVTRPFIETDPDTATVRVSASVTFADLLAALVPRGLLLPVLPGTRHLTVGGAVAADVHGKNHRQDGSIARWIEEIELLDGRGELRHLTRDSDPQAFAATTGGMGLTGIILAVTLRLRRISSPRLRVRVQRLPDLDAVLDAMDTAPDRYCVAWIDTTATGRGLGRGIVECGDHLPGPEPLAYRPGRLRRAPALPFCPLTRWSARAFNEAWFRLGMGRTEHETGLATFFHRLDAIVGWNRSMGPRGILQYQLAVPDDASGLLAATLQRLRGYAPFLGTLKRFGSGSDAPLSFPRAGWALAIDLRAGQPVRAGRLDDLDDEVVAAGGRIYLAKDSRLRPAAFASMYRQQADWEAVRTRLDPGGIFQSDLGRRLGLC
jgi:decaprenylphospho-beta-D-ribofuranose 2-oxidase